MTDSNKNTYYSAADIEKYLNGELSSSEMYALEKASLDDPFLGDALEGMKKDRLQRGTSFFDKDAPELRKKLQERIGRENKEVLPLLSIRYWWRVAATVALVTGLGVLSYYTLIDNPSYKRLAVKKQNNRETKATPADTSSQYPSPATLSRAATPVHLPARKHVPAGTGRIDGNKPTARDLAGGIPGLKTGIPGLKRGIPGLKRGIPGLKRGTPGLKTDTILYNHAMPPLDDKNVFTGKVTGADGKPIAYASIALKGRPVITTTDSSGSFSLYLPEPDTIVSITVRFTGYEALTTVLRNSRYLNAYSNQLRLQPASSALDEVVVTAHGISKSKRAVATGAPSAGDTGFAGILAGKAAGVVVTGKQDRKQKVFARKTEPSVGWTQYNRYLEKNKKITTGDSIRTGKEVISFLVNRSGALSSFRIEQSLSPAHDAEAIRLVRQGPAWRLLKGKKKRATLVIPF